MNRLDSVGELFIQSLGIPTTEITPKLVFDILSLQSSLNPYSRLGSREIGWKIHGKKSQGGHFNIQNFKAKFSALEK